MILIDDILISEDLVDQHFVCELKKCKGACCIEGDFGAPLEPSEIEELQRDLDQIQQVLDKESKEYLAEQPFHLYYPEIKSQGTALLSNGACIFVMHESGIAKCGIEIASQQGLTKMEKPLSCHLYPVRVIKDEATCFEALNYDEWNICCAACILGSALKIPLFQFVRNALIRKYGLSFYQQLEEIARHREDR